MIFRMTLAAVSTVIILDPQVTSKHSHEYGMFMEMNIKYGM